MRLLALAFLASVGSLPATAQFVSVHGGLAQDAYHQASGGVAEIEIGHPFARVGQADALAFDIGLVAGISGREDVETAAACSQACGDVKVGYGYVGARLGAQFNRTLLPVRFTVGVARYRERVRHHDQAAESNGIVLPIGFGEARTYAALDLGVRLLVPVTGAWSLEAGASTSLPLAVGAGALTRFDEDRPVGPTAQTLGVRWEH
ncbi:MAG: hypothetical protein AAGF99_07595 [Bacteroidota bacterium]